MKEMKNVLTKILFINQINNQFNHFYMINTSITDLLLAYLKTNGLTIYRSKDKEVKTMFLKNEMRGKIVSVKPGRHYVKHFNLETETIESISLITLTEEEIKNLKGLSSSDKKIVEDYLAAKNWKIGDEIPNGCQLICNCREYIFKNLYFPSKYEQITISGEDILSFTDVYIEGEKDEEKDKKKIYIYLKFKDEGYEHEIGISIPLIKKK